MEVVNWINDPPESFSTALQCECSLGKSQRPLFSFSPERESALPRVTQQGRAELGGLLLAPVCASLQLQNPLLPSDIASSIPLKPET